MPSSCCVPGCTSNYGSKPPFVSVFKFPKDESLKQQWLKAIHRAEFVPKNVSVVCIKHFDERFVIREDVIKRPDGSILSVKRDRLKLTHDAVPTRFENIPGYLSKKLPLPRKTPAERQEEHCERLEEMNRAKEEKDCIADYEDLCNNFNTKCKLSTSDTYINVKSNAFYIFKIIFNELNVPEICTSLIIDSSLNFKATKCNIFINDNPQIRELFPAGKIDKWSKLKVMCEFLDSFGFSNKATVQDNLQAINNLINNIECQIEDESIIDKLSFCKEQINLALSKKISYCATILTWFASIFFSFPGAYKKIRQAKFLTMPHPKYLQTFTTKLGTGNSGLDNSHYMYLKKKFTTLDDHTKTCNLMMDEIYVKPELTYKGGKLEGFVVNNNENDLCLATTIQTYMISSVLGKNKDVVGLFPVKDLNTAVLQDLTLQVLKALTEIGYKVICIISDNNSVNRNMFERLCNGNLKSYFVNPFDEKQCIYVLFDSVHLFKCIRNNWLNQIDNNQTFIFPDFNDPSSEKKLTASVSHLKMLYTYEENHVVKMAPALSKQVLYPTSIERQNVMFCVRLFDEKNVAALKQLGEINETSIYDGTICFLQIILQWWKIVNVKHRFKDERFNDPHYKPIFDLNDENYVFLKKFLNWLNKWNDITVQGEENNRPKRNGKLTKYTQAALAHTIKSLIELIEVLKSSMNFHYILLGKFQTDDLEERFGLYRQMSGACYHISVKQVLESEKKLKTLSIIKAFSSKHAEIPIRDMFIAEDGMCLNEVDDTDTFSEINELMQFEDISYDIESVSLNKSDLLGLVYIGGYICNSILKHNTCSSCKDTLLLKESESSRFVLPKDNCYFNVIDRGSLKYPTDFIVNVLVVAFKVFNLVISHRYESIFLRCRSQKNVLCNIITHALESNQSCVERCIECGTSYQNIVNKSIVIFSNILLNNYCKLVREKCLKNKQNSLNKKGQKGEKRKSDKLNS